jgi:Phosphotransferase enzyme family
MFDVRGPDMVLERVDGPTMLEVLSKKPHRARSLIATLVQLHRQVHQVEAPLDLRAPFGTGDSLLHLDLHPGNVILADRGPVIIDWPNAARGPGEADDLHTWLLLKTSTAPGGIAARTAAMLFQGLVARIFEHQTGADTKGPLMSMVATRRLEDRNLVGAEPARIRKLIR